MTPDTPKTKPTPPQIDKAKLEQWEDAFSARMSTAVGTCNCGRVFYNTDDRTGITEKELQALDMDDNATPVDYSIRYLAFQGRDYCDACDCWHWLAARCIAFFDLHAPQIADYLSREKKRLQSDADSFPTVQ